jgi:myo-inositol-1-phosphate synthase
MAKVRVAIIGVGNCASSLVQGVYYYRAAEERDIIPGIMHTRLGGYHINDIEFSFGIDIDKNKVGKDLSEAIYTKPNNTFRFCDVPKLNIPVVRGMTHDGLGYYLSQIIQKAPGPTADIVGLLRETKTDVVVNFLPVGSEEATKWYVEQVLTAGCAFINCIPVFIASEKYWHKRFNLVNLFNDLGVKLERTSQLNVGGNTDFLNMLERSRLASKKVSKTRAVTSLLKYDIGKDNVYIGPSDYVAWLKDRKWAHMRLEGRTFGDVPLNIELKLEVWDSPNSAGVVIDAIRCAKLALDNKLSGSIVGPSSYFFKSPPVQYPDYICREKTEKYIKKYGKAKRRK